MGKVIPIANANNVGMNELSTAYAVMTKMVLLQQKLNYGKSHVK